VIGGRSRGAGDVILVQDVHQNALAAKAPNIGFHPCSSRRSGSCDLRMWFAVATFLSQHSSKSAKRCELSHLFFLNFQTSVRTCSLLAGQIFRFGRRFSDFQIFRFGRPVRFTFAHNDSLNDVFSPRPEKRDLRSQNSKKHLHDFFQGLYRL
jgi:hypothetical protein